MSSRSDSEIYAGQTEGSMADSVQAGQADMPRSDDIDTIIRALLSASEETACLSSNRIPYFEQLLHWTSACDFHGLVRSELGRVVCLVLDAFQRVALVYLEDWQAAFDCFDLLLYRLKSAGCMHVDGFWRTLLCLAGRLALRQVTLNEPELATRIMRPLYTTVSILINLHGPDGLMSLSQTSSGIFTDTLKNPFLLELLMKFVIRGMLFFPPWTFSTQRTSQFFVQTVLDHPVSILRRAALEGVRVLRIVKGLGTDLEIAGIVRQMLNGVENREALAAFLFSLEQPVGAKLDYSAESVQLWMDVRDRGKGPELPADIAWVALAGDEWLPLCVRDAAFWEPAPDLAKISTVRTHRLPMAEAGDAAKSTTGLLPKSSSSLKTKDEGAGDRLARKKQTLAIPSTAAIMAAKLTSNTSLSTYNVEEIPIVVALDASTRSLKLTDWAEKEENDSTTANNRLSDGTVVLRKAESDVKVAKKKSTKGKTKKSSDQIESTESAQEFYIGSSLLISPEFSQTPVPNSLHNEDVELSQPAVKVKKAGHPKASLALKCLPSHTFAQTIRLSKTPQSQLNSTWESVEASSLGYPVHSAISRESVPRRKYVLDSSRGSALMPQAKLVREYREMPDSPELYGKDNFWEDLPVIEALGKKHPLSTSLSGQKEQVAEPLPRLSQTLNNRNLKTARVEPSSEFDSGYALRDGPSSASQTSSRNTAVTRESARPAVTLTRSRTEASSLSHLAPSVSPTKIPSNEEDDEINCSVDQSMSASGPQTGRSGVCISQTELPRGKKFVRQKPVQASQSTTLRRMTNADPDTVSETCFRIKPLADVRTTSMGNLFNGSVGRMTATSKESGMESLNDDLGSTATKPLRRFNRLVEPEESEGTSEMSMSKKVEEVRLDLQGLLDRMQKGPRYSNDILLAIEEFVQLSKAFPRVIEGAIGAAFSQFLPLIYNLNSHVAAEAVAGLEIIMPLVECRLHLVAPQIVEALSNNMQNARTCEHSKKVFNQILHMQMDRAGTLLAPLSSHIMTIMKKNKKEAFAFITGKYAETLGFAFPRPPKSQAAAVQILQFIKSVVVWITNYGDLDSSTKPEIMAVDALIQQAIRSFGMEMVNKVCYDYRDTIKIFLSRREGSVAGMLKSGGGVKLQKLVTRKSTLMAFKKKIK